MDQQNYFSELKSFFQKLPGIGPRQASRFIWAILDFTPEEHQKMVETIKSLPEYLKRCDTCFRIFNLRNKENKTCSFCAPTSQRDQTKIMVLEKDSDLLNIERTGFYTGIYHVLGSTFDPLSENPIVRERIKALHERISEIGKLGNKISVPEEILFPNFPIEIILALSATKLGEFTAEYIKKVLESLPIKITRLGRGLSNGTDLEYADEHTLRQALDNRK